VTALRGDASLELGALVGLLFVVVIAGVVIERTARRAEELSQQKSDFVSAVSHELRTPLTTIRMHAEMLRDGLVSEAKRGRFHEDLVAESVRLSRLVDNVLELSRIERGQRPFRPTRGDLVGFVREIVRGQEPMLEAKGFTVRAPEEGEEEVELDFDRQAVEQILVNLLENAAKYGRGEENVVEVAVKRDGRAATITVRDRGPGVPEAERERIFERFHRVERAETAHMPGTGIGLALVRDLASAHGGEATLGPRPDGPGAEARIVIPIG
jgi:signal transduction histidine kinase